MITGRSVLDRLHYDTPDILNHFGPEDQILKCIEEMAELTKELCKFRAYKGTLGVEEEIADCLIMLNQMRHLFGLSEVDIQIHKKLDRIFKRIEK